MAQQLRERAAVPEEQAQFPAPTGQLTTVCDSSLRGSLALPGFLWARDRYTNSSQTSMQCKQNTHTQRKFNKLLRKYFRYLLKGNRKCQ